MFDIGWSEMMLVAVIAIIVVGPKDLPGMLRTVGKSVRGVRQMANQFQSQFTQAINEAERQTGIDDVKKQIQDVTEGKIEPPKSSVMNPTASYSEAIDDDLELDDVEAIQEHSEDISELARKAAEGTAAELKPVEEDVAAVAPAKPAAKRVATKTAKSTTKPAAKKPAAKKPAAKKPAAPRKTAAAKKTTTTKSAAKTSPAKSTTAAKKTTATASRSKKQENEKDA